MVWLYRRPILDYWAEHDETLGAIITHVLVHEIGHHFGLSDDDMAAIEADPRGARGRASGPLTAARRWRAAWIERLRSHSRRTFSARLRILRDGKTQRRAGYRLASTTRPAPASPVRTRTAISQSITRSAWSPHYKHRRRTKQNNSKVR